MADALELHASLDAVKRRAVHGRRDYVAIPVEGGCLAAPLTADALRAAMRQQGTQRRFIVVSREKGISSIHRWRDGMRMLRNINITGAA